MKHILFPMLTIGGIYLAMEALTNSSNKEIKLTSNDESESKKAKREKTDKEDIEPEKHKSEKRAKKESKNGTNENATLYVFYSFGEKNKDWNYTNLPSGWNFEKRVLSTNETKNYNNMDVFNGEKQGKTEIRSYLEHAFSQLKKNEIVRYYKITTTENPV